MAREKCAHLRAVFLVQHRAGDVGDAAAGLEQAARRGRAPRPAPSAAAPARPAACAIWRPGCAARRRCRCRARRSAPGRMRPARSAMLAADRFRRAHLHVARARALEAIVDRRQPPLVVVGGEDLALVLHHRRQRQRLAAGAGAEIDHLLARLGAARTARQAASLRPALRSCLSGTPARHGSPGSWRRRRAGCAGPRATSASAPASRSASIAGGLVAVGLERVDAQIERRARGQRRALLRPRRRRRRGRNADRAIPDNRRRRAAARRRGRRHRAAGARRRSTRSGAYCAPLGELRDRIAVEPALALEHAEQNRARRVVAHQAGARRAPPQRVVDEAGDGGAVAGAGEAMRQPPALERVGGRAPLALRCCRKPRSRRRAARPASWQIQEQDAHDEDDPHDHSTSAPTP